MPDPPFGVADKVNQSLLAPLERRLAPWVLPRLPGWLETYHLTLLTLVWCAGTLAASALAARDRRWLWLAALMVVFQWATDHFDGKLGKFRGTGLVKWGFYVDHLLDYVFICSILIGWSFLLPEASVRHMLYLMAVCAGFVAHALLSFAVSGRFRISIARTGPTELRLAVVAVDVLLIRNGTHGMERALPYAAAGGLVILGALAFATHRRLWREERRRPTS